MEFTYKTKLASEKPYKTLPGDQYLEMLQGKEKGIFQGSFGIYLARKVVVENQELYQPLIDIDAEKELEGDQRIESAIQFAQITVIILKKLGALNHFKIVATGGTGFRAVSNLLLNYQSYQGFLGLVRHELHHIHDLKPSVELETPHQLFAYKGSTEQNSKDLVDRHSTVIDQGLLEKGVFTVDDYLSATDGKLDPSEVISFVQWLLGGPIISDLRSLGDFGKQIETYHRITNEFSVNPFNYIQLRRQTEPIGLNAMKDMLSKKGILSKFEFRGKNQAISFMGLPCPMCGKSSANAIAYPPAYRLKCFNSNCDAHKGMALHQWAGIKNNETYSGSNENSFDLSVPKNFMNLEDARILIHRELEDKDNSLIVMTPGVGKTYSTLQTIAHMGEEQIVIYAAFNKALQEEAYSEICELAETNNPFHLLQPRDETCLRKSELGGITSRGYAPSEILCSKCEYRIDKCNYYAQRQFFGSGVYFVTLHMLQYLEDQIPEPDLIILDENLKAGMLLEENCTEHQLKSALKMIHGFDAVLIIELLNVIQRISAKLVEHGEKAILLNASKLIESDFQETTIIELLAKQLNLSEEELTNKLRSLADFLEKMPRTRLYHQEVDFKAIHWIKGLCSPKVLSFVHINEKGRIQYNTKRITRLGYPNTPIKVLDATGDASALKPLVGRALKTVRADVPWKSNGVHIKISTSRSVMDHAKDEDLKKLLSEMFSYTTSEKVMVLTYKRHEQRIINILEQLDPSRQYLGFHYFGPRGINAFKECGAVLTIGLPYPNLNGAAQDACILFPSPDDSQKRTDWAEACMQWEIIQSIHRIRPVHKSSVDIILAAITWPSILPEPDIVIDRSQSKDWKEIAVKRLEPFVESFGFLNPDIGFLANVYVKSKESTANRFQTNMACLLNHYLKITPADKHNSSTSQLCCVEEFYSHTDNCLLNVESLRKFVKGNYFEDNMEINEIRINLILVIIYYITEIKLKIKSHFFNQLINLLENDKINWTNDAINLSNTNQWSELIIKFKEKYPHFEEFKIKLPHANGHYVTGVGTAKRVKAFYRQINDLGIVGKPVDIGSYQTSQSSTFPINPIPAGFLSIYIPDNEDMACIGWDMEFAFISLKQDKKENVAFFDKILDLEHSQDKIITNNGKQAAKMLRSCSDLKPKIIDVVLTEKIICNGEIELRCVNLKSILKKYEFPEGLERDITVHRLYEIWEKQEKMIEELGLERVFELEKKLIWVTAGVEEAGIGVDVDGMLHYHDTLKGRMNSLVSTLRPRFPEHISLNDRTKVTAHLNSTFGKSLAKIDESILHTTDNDAFKELIGNLLQYWGTKRELDELETYMNLTGPDDCARDSIDQLNTKTGRFYRKFQTVRKDGPIRTFFRAKAGYRFIIADYSQQEARIIAGLSNDQVAIDLFKTNKDLYLETAKIITGGSDAGSQRFRNLAKEIVLGLNNGRSAYSIYDSLAQLGFGFDLDDVQGFILRYDLTFGGIRNWQDNVVSSGQESGIISTVLGRTLKVSSDSNINSLYNFPVQGTAADGFKHALIQLDNELSGLHAQIVHIVHDEVIVEARQDIVEKVAEIIKGCMEKAFNDLLPNVPFVVVPEVRECWG